MKSKNINEIVLKKTGKDLLQVYLQLDTIDVINTLAKKELRSISSMTEYILILGLEQYKKGVRI